MAIALKMIQTIFHSSTTRHGRVEAVATIVMWFSAGAFAVSTIASSFTSHEGQLVGVAGGAVAAVTALFLKAV
jgi:hypothetical protein